VPGEECCAGRQDVADTVAGRRLGKLPPEKRARPAAARLRVNAEPVTLFAQREEPQRTDDICATAPCRLAG